MFWVMDTVRLSDDRGRSRAMPMRLVVDLGNANLLALFAFNLRSENSCHAPLSIWWKAIRRAG